MPSKLRRLAVLIRIQVYFLLSAQFLPAPVGAQNGMGVQLDSLSFPANFNNDFITIENISVSGNQRTKTDVILRELDFQEGDTIAIALLTNRLESNEFKLMNTGLFNFARFNFVQWEATTNKVNLLITVSESWYIYPVPILELADRNFNVWWETYNASLQRLNMGVRFYHNNATGRRDKLKVVYQFGFTRKYELDYTLPYFNKYRSIGLSINLLNTHEKEIGYATSGNQLLFNNDADRTLLKRFRASTGILWRRGLDIYHRWDLAFHHNIINQTVRDELNPNFFLGGLHQRYVALSYEFNFDKRDMKPYPMHGYHLKATASKKGFGVFNDLNSLEVSATYKQYFTLSPKWSVELNSKAKVNMVREKQPYYNSAALGYYLDYIRGYELYVIDGMDYAYHKNSLRYEIINKKVNWGDLMLIKALREMPIRVYLAARNELGYVNNPFYKTGNSLSNELLWGSSIGLDVILYYNKVFNFEVSRNHLNEYGFFLHWNFAF